MVLALRQKVTLLLSFSIIQALTMPKQRTPYPTGLGRFFMHKYVQKSNNLFYFCSYETKH